MTGTPAAFYFDLGSPLAYLAAERVLGVLAGQGLGQARWKPVVATELPGGESFEGFRCGREADAFRAEVERRAGELGLQPIVWPDPFPFDSSLAMRVATYAKSIGRTVPFAQAAFRQAFAGGHSLAEPDFVLIAGAACEMHPKAVIGGAELRSVAEQLRAATEEAIAAGVRDVPALRVGERVFHGERELERAAAMMARPPGGAP